ncbi:hypothetical protein [Saccharolobus sp.]|uniref:hypothetical protein n=1 Tax=Saccharolobus sp. TaxID=2100761 RepID=UPI00316C0BC7
MEQSLEQTLKDLDQRLKELETKFKALSSILGEYVAQLQVLEEALPNNKKTTINLSLDKDNQENIVENIVDTQGIEPRHKNVEPSVPLSSLVFASVEDYDTPTDELKRKIANVADLIIKSGKNLDYISCR